MSTIRERLDYYNNRQTGGGLERFFDELLQKLIKAAKPGEDWSNGRCKSHFVEALIYQGYKEGAKYGRRILAFTSSAMSRRVNFIPRTTALLRKSCGETFYPIKRRWRGGGGSKKAYIGCDSIG